MSGSTGIRNSASVGTGRVRSVQLEPFQNRSVAVSSGVVYQPGQLGASLRWVVTPGSTTRRSRKLIDW